MSVRVCLNLNRVLTNKLMAQLNMDGHGKKIGFRKMRLCKIMIGNVTLLGSELTVVHVGKNKHFM